LVFRDDGGVTLSRDLDAASLLAVTDVAERARHLAQAAHAGQFDKAGNDYYASHLVDVCRRVVSYGGDAAEQAAAWLYDVVEDTAVTELDLLGAGFPDPKIKLGTGERNCRLGGVGNAESGTGELALRRRARW